MAKKQKELNIEDFLRDNLQAVLRQELGRKHIEDVAMPEYFATSLNPMKPFRPYQTEAFQYFISWWENDFEGKALKPQLLFHMATGSGKTLIMAGVILYLYKHGYRNFLFFVNSGNVIEKTKENFFNPASPKCEFAETITLDNKRIEVRQVVNFQDSDPDSINFCLQTIQGLHTDLNNPKENGITYDDFKYLKVALIADEAHHINTATKSSGFTAPSLFSDVVLENMETSDDWETTVMRIFNANAENALFEFTATEDFANPAIADKYKDKVIFDYPLKRFREDGYSKDIAVVQSDLQPIDRAIQAVILSQFRRKLANSIRQDIKPVIMLKSKTIKDNKAFHELFVETVKHLTVDDLQKIKSHAQDDVLDAFTYFEKQGIILENLLMEIKEDFKEENLLLVDGSSITPEKQKHLNSLESKDNEYRAVFAVDMLNEGWDVLNLYDIVRLYDTRDSRNGVVGKTTNSEAQLIGRGARYLPFNDKEEEQQPTVEGYELQEEETANPLAAHESPKVSSAITKPKPPTEYAAKRKFDNQLDNPLRLLETLSYHSPSNPRYIQELNTALAQTGIIETKSIEIVERLKDSFKKSRLYTDGYVFANEQEYYLINESLTNIGENILNGEYSVRIRSGEMSTSLVFEKAKTGEMNSLEKRVYRLGEFGKHILRAAINKFDTLTFEQLHEIFPNLESIKQFIESYDYLANLKVVVYGRKEVIENLTQKEKLFTVVEVLKQVEPLLSKGGIGKRGSRIFSPKQVRDVFHDHRYRVAIGSGSKEDGTSMKETTNAFLRLDLSDVEWYGYDDNFGTEEEKYLIKYIESIIDKLREKYDEVYLLRNYKDLKIYAFADGRATEPDFVLFLRMKENGNQYDNIQIFIEPKGSHLLKTDEWKEIFEMKIHGEATIRIETPNERFKVWGMPFYNRERETEFNKAVAENFMK